MEYMMNSAGEVTNKVKLLGSNNGVELAGFNRGTRVVGLEKYSETILGSKGLTTSLNPFNLNSAGGIISAISTEYALKGFTNDWYSGKLDNARYTAEVGNYFTKVGAVTATMAGAGYTASKISYTSNLIVRTPVGRMVVGAVAASYLIGKGYDKYLSETVKNVYKNTYNRISGHKVKR